jgi:hypothetical protein
LRRAHRRDGLLSPDFLVAVSEHLAGPSKSAQLPTQTFATIRRLIIGTWRLEYGSRRRFLKQAVGPAIAELGAFGEAADLETWFCLSS